jgi:hypothetical protein
MKRRILMVGLAMMAGTPHAICAKGFGKENPADAYAFWNVPRAPQFGGEGAIRPVMDRLAMSAVASVRGPGDAWRVDFTPPASVSAADDPLAAKDRRFGLSLKRSF